MFRGFQSGECQVVVLWFVTLCCLEVGYQSFRETCFLESSRLKCIVMYIDFKESSYSGSQEGLLCILHVCNQTDSSPFKLQPRTWEYKFLAKCLNMHTRPHGVTAQKITV